MNSKLEAIALKEEAILMLRKFHETTEIFNKYGLFEYSINILNKALKFKPQNNKLISLLENIIIIKESEHKIEPNMFNFDII